ncbi:MAG: type VI secretion system-associated FHA domain protein [Pseudomonadota bacterium]
MRLTLEMTTGPQKGARREIGPDSEFCVGTLPDAAWRLPIEDGDGAIWLRADSSGFFFVSEGAVTVEGHPVTPGSPVQLGHGARLDVAGHALRAEVVHQAERLSPLLQSRESAAPTITSILSDVAPRGESAIGALPGRAGENWIAGLGRSSSTARAEALTAPRCTVGTRPALPEDWNANSERVSRLTQTPASDGAVRLAKEQAHHAPPPQADDSLLNAFRSGAGLPEEAEIEDPAALMELAGRLLRVAASGLARAEAEARALFVDYDLTLQPVELSAQPEADVGALLAGPGAEGRLVARFEALTAHQRAVDTALERFIGSARDALDPAAVETRLDARGKRGLLKSREAACWQDYRSAWQGGERSNDSDPPGTEPLSARAFAEALRDAESTAVQPASREGEEGP